MRPLSTDQIRQAYLDFFQKKGHAVIPGASLIPENDPTVLFTTAGMHPLVPYLMGEKHPAGKRLVDVQRCVRTGDIDEVGDSSHLTMFEMLGNWSLGDYFKEEAITMSFEFLTKVLEIPLNKLAVTCFEGDKDALKDTESAGYWIKCGIPEERIGFLPKAKNWWGPAGKTGPCGPDTEMFYWVGTSELPPKGSNPANDDPNWLEIWNDVFLQYNKKEDGTFETLKQQCVDTGMGLERVAKVLQGVESVYETDRMKSIMDVIHAGDMRHRRIICDHLKAATFMIMDGVAPSNVDQGYVLRRIIRRAIRSGKQLGIETAFTPGIAQVVIDQNSAAYPLLAKKSSAILETLKQEEAQFGKTLHEGLKRFTSVAETLTGKIIDGVSAFHLYDTYGFPLELTKELAAERGLTVDEKGFEKAFEEHQKLSRAGAAQKFAGGLADHSAETTKLHTATHLLNAGLRKVLGDHVWQKGSNVTADRLRFDFTHPDKMTPEQIKKVEDLVNEEIKKDLPMAYHLATVDGAKKEGAIGVFDDRYESQVKVYVVGDGSFSKEICGGPHVARTGMLGSFKIQKEESSSAGVRRIKAVVSGGPKEIDVAGEA
ncbi:alanine--tRNA ligase [Candidatus Peribacteria bacterium]|nr:alanine--tRNA ligase [Candidatus Peribacteria bacterium]